MPTSRLALAAALALVAAAAPAVAKKSDTAAVATVGVDAKNISKGVRPLLLDAQKLEAAGNLPGALAQVRAAEAIGNLNSTDSFYIGQSKLGIAIKTKDNALAEEALKPLLTSEFTPATEKPKYLRNLSSFALNRNDYNMATQYFEQLTALPGASGEDFATLGELYARQKQTPQAIAALDKAIAAGTAAGKPAGETTYQRKLQLAYDAKLAPQTATASIDLIKAYPTPPNWRSVLYILRENQKLDDQGNLDVFRLMDAAGALNGERDYAEYTETAIGKGLPGEAKAVLAEGVQKGMISSSKSYVVEYNKTIASRIGADRAGLAAIDKEARAAANGKTALGEGDAYYGYGDYAKSAEMYRLALTKGGVDAATANLRLGAALARAGDKAGAATALAAVSGGPRTTLAQYWTLWLAQKG